MKKIHVLLCTLTTIILLSGCTTTKSTTGSNAAIEKFASCLTSKGATFYGTQRCPHCKDQKKLFGDALAKVNYVDCDASKLACSSANIKGYPTWVFADGSQLVGTQQLESLASKTGCEFAPEALVAEQQKTTTQ